MATFESFAERFVQCYWETVKSQRYSMPPNEPVEESLNEILSGVTFETEVFGEHVVLMRSGEWAWWKFTFVGRRDNWTLARASARSLDESVPHNLLIPPYERLFRPFLIHVTQCAQRRAPA